MTSFRHIPSELRTNGQFSGTDGSLLLLSASFEERCLGLVQNLPSSARFRSGLLYVNDEFLSGPASTHTKSHMNSLRIFLGEHCDYVYEVIGSWLDPVKQVTALRKISEIAQSRVSVSPQGPICIDATTFTRESLLVACALLSQNVSAMPLRVFYSSPQKHGEWLSRGFREVRNVMGFPGIQTPGAPTSLIVLSGFEPDRTCRLIEAYEPSEVLLGIGNPATNHTFLDRNVAEQKLILSRQDVHKFYFPANSVAECASTLRSMIASHSPSNIIIAPMCTKLSTIAAFLVAEENHAIQLAYSVPGEYNIDEYSSGISAIYSEDITLP